MMMTVFIQLNLATTASLELNYPYGRYGEVLSRIIRVYGEVGRENFERGSRGRGVAFVWSWPLWRGGRCREVAFYEGRCREVAVVERWSL